MKLISIAHNMRVLELDDGTEILFSYSTPVAGNNNLSGFFVTEEYHSRTTMRHINRYLSQYDLVKGAKKISQATIDQMVVTTTTPKETL